jgi:hypothetical protein
MTCAAPTPPERLSRRVSAPACLCALARVAARAFGRPCAPLAALRPVSAAVHVHTAARLCKALAGRLQAACQAFKSFSAPIRATLAFAGRGTPDFCGKTPRPLSPGHLISMTA